MPTFATAINCMDGRAQQPVIDFVKHRADVEYVDMITEAGTIKFFSDPVNESMLSVIRKSVEISVKRHLSKHVYVVAHHDCAGNPMSDCEQKAQVVRAKHTVEAWGMSVKVSGLWVNADWQVEEF
jgi:carbonic anhydrase